MPAKAKQPPKGAPVAEAAPLNGLAAQTEGRRRVVIERVAPELDGGRFPIKRGVGETVVVSCDAFADGHDVLAVALRFRTAAGAAWHEVPMQHLGNDRWQASFAVEHVGRAFYTVQAWIDRFATWEHQLHKRVEAGQDVRVELLIGAELVAEAAEYALPDAAAVLRSFAAALREGDAKAGFSPELAQLMATYLPRRYATTHERELAVTVDRPLARCSAWYELFPRSAALEPGRHGTFRDLIERLPYVAELGFDILYMPPIHPIGRTFRKGKNNSVTAEPGEPGSPWAIGAVEGGHKSIHPELGTLEDFHALVQAAKQHGLEIALDIAFQCAPDHPYVTEHPEWFRARPDGTIQYAENPPKKYQDIYPFDFETSDWPGLWQELKSIFAFWIAQGVTVFRVDNPHTKSFPFWEWCIGELKRDHPELIFLAEAFSRPKLMYGLAKLGFTQSYTYFTWRTTKWELTEYMLELTQGEPREFFGPNFWPNTPDILTPQFYTGQRSVFLTRAALAATLTASWGLYGPVYELLQYMPVKGREEYLDNEKYEIHHWNLKQPESISWFIAALNRIRRANPALQRNAGLRFHRVDFDFHESDQIIAYSKATPDLSNIVLVVLSLDPDALQRGWVQLPAEEWGLGSHYEVQDLLTGASYTWTSGFNYVELDPATMPLHILHVQRVEAPLHDVGDYV
ncbi:MAG: alpha-1,4-glucan--maltose-1-phosphate maltosyltransferase [Candidatus Viridilinea halotolerans]|uniref:Alpha-1,4-glucan:maltose-1-phosphate maltosyltransferase n=1 Tax=Candidatus Viridilinea halotolerans TaxID=2491704 RepID=A0A426U586_9CHLR|nr:MAG: alpha-1,4-glucan--maltose-1-phosphate maltosyltransferase [Candidatus Viridilinea halotolerans]